jgi:hypothetical protein
MIAWDIRILGLDDAQDWLDSVDRAKEQALMEVLETGSDASSFMYRAVHVETGRLQESINLKHTVNDPHYQAVEITAPAKDPETGIEYAYYENKRGHSHGFFDLTFQYANDVLYRRVSGLISGL